MSRNILVIEDDPKTAAAAVRIYLEREGYGVTVVHNGRDAVREARSNPPALVILDLMLPQMSGVEVCRTLRAESEVYIIMLTARSTEQDKLRGLDLGADDYVTKPFSPRELVARVRAVLRRRRPEPEPETPEIRVEGLVVDLERHEVRLHERTVYLTPAEFKLLETFVRAPERVFTRGELVERAFGHGYGALDRTVDAHVMNLRRKIAAARPGPSFIVTVYGVGYKFSAQRDA